MKKYTQEEFDQFEVINGVKHCNQVFMVSTSITYYHEGEKCPCKNGLDHDWQPTIGDPKEYHIGRERCSFCDEDRDTHPAEERRKLLGAYCDSLNKNPI